MLVNVFITFLLIIQNANNLALKKPLKALPLKIFLNSVEKRIKNLIRSELLDWRRHFYYDRDRLLLGDIFLLLVLLLILLLLFRLLLIFLHQMLFFRRFVVIRLRLVHIESTTDLLAVARAEQLRQCAVGRWHHTGRGDSEKGTLKLMFSSLDGEWRQIPVVIRRARMQIKRLIRTKK